MGAWFVRPLLFPAPHHEWRDTFVKRVEPVGAAAPSVLYTNDDIYHNAGGTRRLLVVYTHGNGEDVQMAAHTLSRELSRALDTCGPSLNMAHVTLACIEYTGYVPPRAAAVLGLPVDARSSELAARSNVRAALRQLMRGDPCYDDVLFLGYSMGTALAVEGVAYWHAHSSKSSSSSSRVTMALISPPMCIFDTRGAWLGALARVLVGDDAFETWRQVRALPQDALAAAWVVHGTEDVVVPSVHGVHVALALDTRLPPHHAHVDCTRVHGATHVDVPHVWNLAHTRRQHASPEDESHPHAPHETFYEHLLYKLLREERI